MVITKVLLHGVRFSSKIFLLFFLYFVYSQPFSVHCLLDTVKITTMAHVNILTAQMRPFSAGYPMPLCTWDLSKWKCERRRRWKKKVFSFHMSIIISIFVMTNFEWFSHLNSVLNKSANNWTISFVRQITQIDWHFYASSNGMHYSIQWT